MSPDTGSAGEVTRLLQAVRNGERDALDRIVPLVYDQLRQLARRQLAREGPDHTLHATALVHEAYFKLADARAERISTGMRYETAEAALGAAFAGGPVALGYSHFDERTREEAHEEYLASIEPYRNGRGYMIPGEFVVARGSRPARSDGQTPRSATS